MARSPGIEQKETEVTEQERGGALFSLRTPYSILVEYGLPWPVTGYLIIYVCIHYTYIAVNCPMGFDLCALPLQTGILGWVAEPFGTHRDCLLCCLCFLLSPIFYMHVYRLQCCSSMMFPSGSVM
jgi:hypothetical protein